MVDLFTLVKKAFVGAILFVLFLLQQNSGYAQMRQVYLDGQQSANQISKISFYSPSSGFVAFTDWIGFTSDSGHTFSKKYITIYNVDFSGYAVNLTFGFNIRGVKAFDKDTVIAYGDYGFVPAILYSLDGANTFKLIFLSQYNNLKLSNGIADMLFPENNKVGYAVDADRVLKTVDKGLTWNTIRIDADSYLNNLIATDNNNVFAFSQDPLVSKLIKTNNGGNSWQQVTVPALYNGRIKYADFITPLNGWLNIFDGGGIQELYYTMDGGTNWVHKNDDDATSFLCGKMKFINDSTGVATEDFFNTYKTTDSGKIWEPFPRDNNFTYLLYSHNDLQVLDSTQLWAGGGSGFLELNTNVDAPTLPKAYFKINIEASNAVDLIDFSKTQYEYKWFVNNVLISKAYNTSYVHNNITVTDTIELIVTKGSYSDTLIKYGRFNNSPPPPVPAITSFTPTIGEQGTIISIAGSNFTGATAVYFGGVPATTFTVVSSSQINATVGTGASGTLSVVTPYGTASQPGFAFRTLLKVVSFSPASGPIGTTVTITGTNFSPVPSDDIVYFGAVRTSVLYASTTQLTVLAPEGATYLPLSVTVNGLTAYSELPFVLTFAGGQTITKNTYPAKIDFPTDMNSIYITNADLDGDGKPDIVTGEFAYMNRVTVLRNVSTADSVSFEPEKFFQLMKGYNNVWGPVLITDADGDGKPDIIAGNGTNLSYLKNESTKDTINFGAAVSVGGIAATYLAKGDFDGDGKPDIACVNQNSPSIRIFQNSTTAGVFSLKDGYTIHMNSDAKSNVVVEDFDGDGKPDILTVDYNVFWGVYVYRNTSNAGVISFAAPVALPDPNPQNHAFYYVVAGDFDGDGKPDVAAIDGDSTISIYRNTSVKGTLNFVSRIDFHTGYSISTLAINDLNGDGKPDIALAINLPQASSPDKDIQVSVLENKSVPGNILFGPHVDFGYTTENHNTKDICIADFNGDGKSEIAVVNPGTTNVSILLKQGGALPVTLLDFSAQLENNNAVLNWQTALEENSNYFNVQRSKDGIVFSDIGMLRAAGNSNIEKEYDYTDFNVNQLNTDNLFYRLEEVDKDGKIQLSKIVAIRLKAGKNEIKVYPNPANSTINIDLPQRLSGNTAIILYDMIGHRIIERKNLSNSLHQQLSIKKVTAGNYRLIIIENGKEKINKSVVITH